MAINYHDGGGSTHRPDLDVEPAHLAEFADLLDGDLIAIADAWEQWRGELDSQPDPNFPGEHGVGFGYANGYPEAIYDGSGGIHEARAFYRAYDRTLKAERDLMRDLITGLATLRDAARMIHDGYLASDAANADDLEGAFAAYERSAVIEALGQPDQPAGREDPE